MRRIQHATAVTAPPALPTLTGPTGFFTGGNPGAAVPATLVPDWWLNMIQEEIAGAIAGRGLALDGTKTLTDALFGSVLNIQVFTASGTYLQSSGAKKAWVRAVGGGAAAGGATATAAGGVSAGTPGTAGAYGEGLYNITGNVAVTIGAAGMGAVGASGGNGGTTSFGAFLSCPGGIGGSTVTAASSDRFALSASSSGLPIGANIAGSSGGVGSVTCGLVSGAGSGGAGGDSILGKGGPGQGVNSAGNAAGGRGGGGGGCVNIGAGTSAIAGGNGVAGIVIVVELS